VSALPGLYPGGPRVASGFSHAKRQVVAVLSYPKAQNKQNLRSLGASRGEFKAMIPIS